MLTHTRPEGFTAHPCHGALVRLCVRDSTCSSWSTLRTLNPVARHHACGFGRGQPEALHLTAGAFLFLLCVRMCKSMQRRQGMAVRHLSGVHAFIHYVGTGYTFSLSEQRLRSSATIYSFAAG